MIHESSFQGALSSTPLSVVFGQIRVLVYADSIEVPVWILETREKFVWVKMNS